MARMHLADAVRTFVKPNDHLHFASTPSRSNASIREIARAFRGTDPAFVVSTSGFHSTAHLLAKLRLGRRYIACFYGDNYPAPRPHPLYRAIEREGAVIERWSLLSYVSALRAGALGNPWTPVQSLAGTTLGDELASQGRFCTERHLVSAVRPDVVFVHAPVADEDGRVAFSAPYGEGFWSAFGARKGVIATVERIVPREVLDRLPDAVRIAPYRLLAVCEEPFGAHPQPLYTTPAFAAAIRDHASSGYVDDFEHYERWRDLASNEESFADFSARVLDAPLHEGSSAYADYVGRDRLQTLANAGEARRGCASFDERETPSSRRRVDRALVDLAANVIAGRVTTRGHRTLLAGIGNAFFAAHAAKRRLASTGHDVAIMVETGLFDVSCGDACHGFLLSHDHISSARALSSVEDVLGALTTGADNRCLGILGAAEVDASGNVNSTRLEDGTPLVGSGGANDIASGANEVVVLTACDKRRLVQRVAHVTSPGHRVVAVVTERCVFERNVAGARNWHLTQVLTKDGESVDDAVRFVLSNCSWDVAVTTSLRSVPQPRIPFSPASHA